MPEGFIYNTGGQGQQQTLPVPQAPQDAQQSVTPATSEGRANIVTLPDGTKHLFPSGTTPDQMRKALNLGPEKPQTNWIDELRPFIAGGAGALAGIGTSLIPGVGETGVAQLAADTQTYALVDAALKYAGANPPKSFTEALTNSEADAAINAVAGKLMGTVFKGAKAFFSQSADIPAFYKLAPTTSQALERYGMKKLATVTEFLEDYGAPKAKAEALDKSGGQGFTQALAHANAINGRQAGTNSDPQKLYDKIKFALQDGLSDSVPEDFNYKTVKPGISSEANKLHYASQEALDLLNQGSDHFEVLNNVLNNTDKLSKVLKVGQIAGSPSMNVKQDLAAYKFMDIINKASTKDLNGGARINPDMLKELWTGYDSDKKTLLFGKEGANNIGEFLKDLSYAQQVQANNPMLSKYIKYGTMGKFMLGIWPVMHAFTTGDFTYPGILAGLQITGNQLGRLLTKPTTARIITDMAKGKLEGNAVWTSKMLGNALRNQTVGLVGGDGSTTDGSIEENPQTGMLEFRKY